MKWLKNWRHRRYLKAKASQDNRMREYIREMRQQQADALIMGDDEYYEKYPCPHWGVWR